METGEQYRKEAINQITKPVLKLKIWYTQNIFADLIQKVKKQIKI